MFALMQAWLIFTLGCGAQGPEKVVMKFDVASKANEDMPVTVDVVVTYDTEMRDRFERMTAAEWFAQYDQLIRSSSGSQKFEHWRWEMTPGTKKEITKRLRGEPADGIVFADYSSRGKHAARFDPFYAYKANFRQSSFSLVPGNMIEPESKGWRPPVGWTLIGVGLVGLGLGTFFSIMVSSSEDGMDDNRQEKDAEKYEEYKEDRDHYRVGQIVSFSVGGALLVAGILILVWPTSNESLFDDLNDSDEGSEGSVTPW